MQNAGNSESEPCQMRLGNLIEADKTNLLNPGRKKSSIDQVALNVLMLFFGPAFPGRVNRMRADVPAWSRLFPA